MRLTLSVGLTLAALSAQASDPICNGKTVEGAWDLAEAPYLHGYCILHLRANDYPNGDPMDTGTSITECAGIEGMAWAGTYRAVLDAPDSCRIELKDIGSIRSMGTKEVADVEIIYQIGDSSPYYDPREPSSMEEACSMAGNGRDTRPMLRSKVYETDVPYPQPTPWQNNEGGMGVMWWFTCQAQYQGDPTGPDGEPLYWSVYGGKVACLRVGPGPAASQHECDGGVGARPEWARPEVMIDATLLVDPAVVSDGPTPMYVAEDEAARWRRGTETNSDGVVRLIRR